MGIRGRTSSAELAIIGPGGVETVQRPQAPAELTDEQADEWCAIIGRLPAEYFPRETHGMLAQYCRHITRARHLAQLIAQMEASDSFDVGEYRALLQSEETQSRAIATIASKLRLSHSAIQDRRQRRPTSAKRPWE